MSQAIVCGIKKIKLSTMHCKVFLIPVGVWKEPRLKLCSVIAISIWNHTPNYFGFLPVWLSRMCPLSFFVLLFFNEGAYADWYTHATVSYIYSNKHLNISDLLHCQTGMSDSSHLNICFFVLADKWLYLVPTLLLSSHLPLHLTYFLPCGVWQWSWGRLLWYSISFL